MTRRSFLFAMVDHGGNVPPELGVARRLAARGHDVTILTDDSIAHDAAATGAAVRRWERAPNRPDRSPSSDPARDWECRFPWQAVERVIDAVMIGPAPAYAHDVTHAIATVRPDRVVCSMMCVGAMIAAESAGVPFDVLYPNVYPLPAPGLPPFGLGLRPAGNAITRAWHRAVARLGEWLWDRRGLARLVAIRHELGLPPVDHLTDQFHRAHRELLLTAACFDFPAQLPARVRYVGPILDDPSWAATTDGSLPLDDAPLVLVAMSTTFQDQVACLQRVIDGLAELGVHALVTTGPALDPTALHARAGTTIRRSAPHRAVLERAAAVVTHGGHGTAMKALVAGVPLVLLPHGRDQADTAVRICARGAGVTLHRRAQASTIATAVRAVIDDPSYRTAARRLGAAIQCEVDDAALLCELEANVARSA